MLTHWIRVFSNGLLRCIIAIVLLISGCDRAGGDFVLNKSPVLGDISVLTVMQAFGTPNVHLYQTRNSVEAFLGLPSAVGDGYFEYRKGAVTYHLYYDDELLVSRMEVYADPMVAFWSGQSGKGKDIASGETQAQVAAKLGAPSREQSLTWFYDSLFTGFIFSHPGKRVIGVTLYSSPRNPHHVVNSGRTILAIEGKGTSDFPLLTSRSKVELILGAPVDSTDTDFIYKSSAHIYFVEYGTGNLAINIILLSPGMAASEGPTIDQSTGIIYRSTRAEVLQVYGSPEYRGGTPESWFYLSRGIGFLFSDSTDLVSGAWVFLPE